MKLFHSITNKEQKILLDLFVYTFITTFPQSQTVTFPVSLLSDALEHYFLNKSATFSTVNYLILVFINSTKNFQHEKLFNFPSWLVENRRKKNLKSLFIKIHKLYPSLFRKERTENGNWKTIHEENCVFVRLPPIIYHFNSLAKDAPQALIHFAFLLWILMTHSDLHSRLKHKSQTLQYLFFQKCTSKHLRIEKNV